MVEVTNILNYLFSLEWVEFNYYENQIVDIKYVLIKMDIKENNEVFIVIGNEQLYITMNGIFLYCLDKYKIDDTEIKIILNNNDKFVKIKYYIQSLKRNYNISKL